MARRENKSKSGKVSKLKAKESIRESMDHDFESGDNPDERERTSGNTRS